MTGDTVALIKRINLVKFCIGGCIRTNIRTFAILYGNIDNHIVPAIQFIGCWRDVFVSTRAVIVEVFFEDEIACLVEFIRAFAALQT